MPENYSSASIDWARKTFVYLRGSVLLIPGFMLSTGCLYHAREATDDTVREMAARPFDQLPEQLREKPGLPAGKDQSSAIPGTQSRDTARQAANATVPTDVQTVAYMEAAQAGQPPPVNKFDLIVPSVIPGSEAPLLTNLPNDPAKRREVLRQLYTPLPPLAEEVKPLPGPNGKPYTLSDFQRIAAENSPTLRQAASDVQAAKGSLIQAATYQNPNVSLQEQASNNNSTGGAFGFSVDQVVSTGGKMRLQTASAQKTLENNELALRRARSDLATAVRNAYYALLVSKETMRVTRAVSVLTDEVYRVQLASTEQAGQSAPYEPAALRAQAWTARLAYQQAIANYVYNWKQLVATISVRQLPLSEVAGRIDAVVPYYEYDKVLAHILRNHTDMLTAHNGIEIQKNNLKVNQIQPYFPNVDFNIGMFRDRALLPYGTYATFGATVPLPIWDQNKGNILQAEAALARALEEPHRVEMVLTNNLGNNFTNYVNNLKGVEFYRSHILPDQVRAYRGVLARRQVDGNSQFGDLVAAQQSLAGSVTTYLGLLGSLWTSVISVADMLQTDDLFQTAEPRGLPPLPDLESLPPLPCCHPFGQNAANPTPCLPSQAPPATPQTPSPTVPMLQPPRPIPIIGPKQVMFPTAPTPLFKLTESALFALKEDKVPNTVLFKLMPLKDREFAPGDFMAELANSLTPEEGGQYQSLILNRALCSNQAETPVARSASENFQQVSAPVAVSPPIPGPSITLQPVAIPTIPAPSISQQPVAVPPMPAPNFSQEPAPGIIPSVLPGGQ